MRQRLRIERTDVLGEFETTLADDDDVARDQDLFQRRRAVHKNVVDASREISVFKIAVDDLDTLPVIGYVRVFSRRTTVVEDDIVFLGAAYRIDLAAFEIEIPNATTRLGYFDG